MNKQILKNVKSLLKDGEEGSYLMLDLDPYFVQISKSLRANNACIRAVSNIHLKPEHHLSPEKDKQMLALGLALDPTNQDYYLEVPNTPDAADKISVLVEKVFEVYGVNPFKVEIDLVID